MRIKKNSKEEIEIEQMKDIMSIDYRDLFLVNSSGKSKIIPGFLVVFENGNILYYTTHDSHFDSFVRRLREVYLEEKDRPVREGFFGIEKIQISPIAEKILLSGDLEKVSDLYHEYSDKEGYSDSLLFEEDEFHSIFPIFDYHIRTVMKQFGVTIQEIRPSNGINGNYFLTAVIHNAPVILPITFRKEDQMYSMTIGGLLDHSVPLNIDIIFGVDSIKVNSQISDYRYFDYSTYEMKAQPTVTREVYWDGKCITFHKENLPQMENPPDNILPKEFLIKWYQTLWDGMIGIYQKKEELDDHSFIEEKYYYYIHRNDEYYYEREKDSKRYYQIQSFGNEYSPIIFDSMDKKKIGVKNGDILLFEHSFYDPCRTGFYKDHLFDQHFYSCSKASSWGEVNDENEKFLSKQDGIEDSIDLVDNMILEKRLG